MLMYIVVLYITRLSIGWPEYICLYNFSISEDVYHKKHKSLCLLSMFIWYSYITEIKNMLNNIINATCIYILFLFPS